jgi:hypothetical protein
MNKIVLLLLVACSWLGTVSTIVAAPQGKQPTAPDFTNGDSIPANAKHDWNLGPTGLRGWMFCDKLVTTAARQIAITKVAPGSPADQKFVVGDVILGVGGKPFAFDPRTELGRAITFAETEGGAGRLVLTRWRSGTTEEIALQLPIQGEYSGTAPYDCPKSQHVLEQGLQQLAGRMSSPNYEKTEPPIPRSLHALALLASGDAVYLPIVHREALWAANFSAKDFKTWHYGYAMMFLAEYTLATGDDSVLPGLRRLALEAANGQSAVGSWGHTFALPDGRLKGYGMMNAPGLPLTIGLVLAREAGVDDPEVANAIERSANLLRFYSGKGAVPYGDHPAWTETHEDNGKCGMAAMLFNLLGETKHADYFTRMAVAAHGNERDGGHTGNYFNMLWSLPAIALAGPNATGAWTEEFGAWYHDLARVWDGSFAHQGPPESEHDSYHNWDATGAYLLAYALPRQKILLTGRKPAIVPAISLVVAQSLIDAGRGWDNKDRRSFYDQLANEELLARLGSWSPIVRQRAAAALARRKDSPISEIIALLESENVQAQIGACHALEELRGRAAPAVPQVQRLLQHEDLWVRVRAATVLAEVGKPGLVALPELLEIIARRPSADDPRAMEQRFVAAAVFSKMLTNAESLAGVDHVRLRAAIVQGLQNQDGHARGYISGVFTRLSFAEIQPLLPAVLEAIQKPAPSGEMFADEVRLNGLKVLAAHHVEAGMQACVDYLQQQNPWASEHRTPKILAILDHYGADAQRLIPQLQEAAAAFDRGEPDFPKRLSQQKAAAVRAAIEKIQTATDRPKLKQL